MSERGAALDPARFPALRRFVRGYLHEDLAAEHGTAEAAARAFRADASPSERAEVVREWNALRAAVEPGGLVALREALAALGAAWRPRSLAEADRFGSALGAKPE